jgi:Suppressor of fused protein (SUFU)
VNDEPSSSATVTSLSGSPIYRHGEGAAWEAPIGEEFIEQISAHIEEHLGPIETVFHEIVSDTVHIDVHFLKPTPEFPFVRLVTSGMSDLPMKTPEDLDIPKFVELLITLPSEWRLDQKSLEDEAWYWPVGLLKNLARLPHKHKTWLGWGHTVPNGDPSQPYSSNTNLSGAILLPSVTVPTDFHQLTIPSQKQITFYSVVPLYESEMNLKLRDGSKELLKRFDKWNISDVVSLTRRDVSRKTFGLW